MRSMLSTFGRLGLIAGLSILCAGASSADWKAYVAADLGISGASLDTDGETTETVTVDVLQGDGSLAPASHTFYLTQFGPMIILPPLA